MTSTFRMVTALLIACAWIVPAFAADPSERVVIVHAGMLLSQPGSAPRAKQTVMIRGARIERVIDGLVDPKRLVPHAEFIDFSQRFVLPGLMDMHVHLLGQLGPDSRTEALTLTTAMKALRGARHARRTLRAGFTTVRDLGADPEAIYALRDAIDQGIVPGPRVLAAGSSIAATGGHGDVDGYKAELLKLWTPETICDGPYDCRRAARHAIKYGADWIKITATGGVLSDTATGTDQQMTDDELSEIVSTAHALGRRVAAHAHGTDGIIAALRAGVDSIDHGTFLDDEAVKLFKRSGAYLVPTLLPGHLVPPMMEGNPFFTDAIKAKARAASAASKGSLKRAYEAGVRIAFGTDSGVTRHGQNAQEFALMVAAGMDEMDAIYAATVASADLLGRSDSLGTIEAGKFADLIAVNGNPLEDITLLERVDAVIKEGRLVR